MNKAVWIDQDACISCGLCVANVPEVFRFADNGKAEVYDPNRASGDVIQQDAIDICPVSCIQWK